MCSQYVTVLFFAVSEFLKCVRSGLLGFVVFVSWFILSVLLFEFLRHCHKFLCSNSLAVGQESGSCESTFLSVRGVKLVYKQVTRENPRKLHNVQPDPSRRHAVCTRPRRHIHSGSRIRSKLVSLLWQEVACSTVCAAGCHELFVQASNLKLTRVQFRYCLFWFGFQLFPLHADDGRLTLTLKFCLCISD